MILSEKWPAEPPPPFHSALRSPGPDLHPKHFPLIHSYQTCLAPDLLLDVKRYTVIFPFRSPFGNSPQIDFTGMAITSSTSPTSFCTNGSA